MGPVVVDVLRLKEEAIVVGKVKCLHTRLRPHQTKVQTEMKKGSSVQLADSLLRNKPSCPPPILKLVKHTMPLACP
jgi:hypothetical protein